MKARDDTNMRGLQAVWHQKVMHLMKYLLQGVHLFHAPCKEEVLGFLIQDAQELLAPA